ncbi:hypothetical protein jhhlp_005191 [Lomentospora prolificans]|uniref:PIG-P domain-containing protein n=1 Tax=Lomentospora prolificans TaxID=41688 RepID=A0A2N3N736_9PEZI|nr:hypothetical protein jhhlp_005191 [Lomentospora prolificans]
MPGTIEEEGELELASSDAESTTSSASNESGDNASPSRPSIHPPNYFAPPFYGRPGTPLPPSPSITSLLIPSRPTTPDLSDDEMEVAARATRASPKVPTYEYYGFVLYLFSSATFLVYILWSYLPSPFLHALGIYYYPNRWWSLAVPAFLVMALVYLFVALASYNTGYLTPPMGAVETVVDDAAKVAVIDAKGRMRDGSRLTRSKVSKRKGTGGGKRTSLDYTEVWGEGTDGVMDVPLAGVCEVLYREKGSDETDEEGVEYGDVEEERWWPFGIPGRA